MMRAVASLSWETFAAAADRLTERFVARTDPMPGVDSSILFSDGFCFCALCELFDVNVIVEAGTGYGGSTEMFARYFAGTPMHIWSVDDAVSPRWQWLLAVLHIRHYSRFVWSTERRAKDVARKRLAPYPNVTLVRGDAHVKIPRLVREAQTRGARIGILLDGPKGEEQMQLAERLLQQFENVAFVAVDDIGPIFDVEGRGARFRASQYATFATSDRPFFDRYGWINKDRLPKRMQRSPGHSGYGMGILVR
jgi:hypothetical protein